MENNLLTKSSTSVRPLRGGGPNGVPLEKDNIRIVNQHKKRSFAYGKMVRNLAIILITPITLYYLWTRGFVYLNYSRELYTDYFWGRAPWLLTHILLGIVATLIGPFQFIPYIRQQFPAVHRAMGKVYISSILISTMISFYLVSGSGLGVAYGVGLTALGVVWLTSTMMAYVAIRKRNLSLHREWMIKSYVLTLAFVSFRVVEDALIFFQIGEFIDRKILMAWGCWAVPFFVTEVILQSRKLIQHRAPAAIAKI
jgi:uncharacterized membrane protein